MSYRVPGFVVLALACVLAMSATAAVTTLSGTVTGATDATVTLTGQTVRTATAGAAGLYTFSGVGGGIYTVAPSASGHWFTPVSVAQGVSSASVTNVDFKATATSESTYVISGAVKTSGTGRSVITLNGTNVGSVATELDGSFSFEGLPAGTYTVSASHAGETFSHQKLVTLGRVDSTNNEFTAVATPPGGDLTLSVEDPLPEATVGKPYTFSLIKGIAGAKGAVVYQTGTLASGAPPLGMLLHANGTLTGTARVPGKYEFRICAADAEGNRTTLCAPTTLTVAPAVTIPAPSPPPPAPAPGTSWVYYDGHMNWPGDYSFSARPDYSDASGEPLSGSSDIKVSIIGQWGGWLPYAQNWDFNSVGYTKLTFSLKPTVANQIWNVYFVKVGDVPVGIYLDPTHYGPAPVPGKWATYTIPLADLGVLGSSIYKFCIHDETGLGSNTWYVDNVGFVP